MSGKDPSSVRWLGVAGLLMVLAIGAFLAAPGRGVIERSLDALGRATSEASLDAKYADSSEPDYTESDDGGLATAGKYILDGVRAYLPAATHSISYLLYGTYTFISSLLGWLYYLIDWIIQQLIRPPRAVLAWVWRHFGVVIKFLMAASLFASIAGAVGGATSHLVLLVMRMVTRPLWEFAHARRSDDQDGVQLDKTLNFDDTESHGPAKAADWRSPARRVRWLRAAGL